MSRADKAFRVIMTLFLVVIAFLVGIIVAGRHAAEDERKIEHMCIELDNAGSDSTDPVILDACQP